MHCGTGAQESEAVRKRGVVHFKVGSKFFSVASREHAPLPTHCFATYAATVAVGASHTNGARVALHIVAKFARAPKVALVTWVKTIPLPGSQAMVRFLFSGIVAHCSVWTSVVSA